MLWGSVAKLASGKFGLRTKVGQGDIICRPATSKHDKPRWGFVVTADCDIAQDKAGARLSCLEIVTIQDYLEHIWSAEVLRKLRPKVLKEGAVLISRAAQARDQKFDELSPNELLEWLNDTPRLGIVAAIEIPEKKQKQHLEVLEIIELVFGIRTAEATALQRLRGIWIIQGSSPKTMRSRLEQAIDYNQATDFHLIPMIPGAASLGYVVLLREVSSILHDNILPTALDLQIMGNADGYYIAGPVGMVVRFNYY